jgi:hypothetical protein
MCTGVLLVGMSLAQTAAPETSSTGASTESAGGMKIAAGTAIPAELTKSLDAKKSKQGDRVEARTTQDLLSNGQIVIPRGTRVIGKVTEAQPRAKSETSSMLGISFNEIAMKDGKSIPVNAGIQAISKPVQAQTSGGNENEPMSESGGMGGGMHGSVGATGGMGRPDSTGAGVPGGGYPAGAPENQQSTTNQGAGALSAESSGIVGLKDLSLSQGPQGSVISSDSKNVHLDSGTQLILKVN